MEVVCDVETEPPLAPLQGEAVSGNTADGARVDVRARGLWSRQQNAFLIFGLLTQGHLYCRDHK